MGFIYPILYRLECEGARCSYLWSRIPRYISLAVLEAQQLGLAAHSVGFLLLVRRSGAGIRGELTFQVVLVGLRLLIVHKLFVIPQIRFLLVCSALGPAKKRMFSLPQRLLPPLKVSSTSGAEPVVFFPLPSFFSGYGSGCSTNKN